MSDKEYLEKYLEPSLLEEGFKRLQQGEPVQYIVGNVDFCGNTIFVNSDVLIPRFETELLVDKTYNYIKEYFDKDVRILDIGTGSGCISIALKKLLECSIDGVDISSSALEMAKKNASYNNVDINLKVSDLFSSVDGKYDVIISNPPYISFDEDIDDVVRNNEPNIALFADNNGLYFYEKILKEAGNYINDKGLIAFEIGRSQGDAIKNMALKYFPQAFVSVEKDFPGEDRFVFIFIGLA